MNTSIDRDSLCLSTAASVQRGSFRPIIEEYKKNVVNFPGLNLIELTSGRFWAPPPRPSPPAIWKTSRKAAKHNDMLTFRLAAANYEAWHWRLTNYSNTVSSE